MKNLVMIITLVLGSQTFAATGYMDQHFKSLDEVQKIERETLGLPEKTVGPMTDMAICISTQIASNYMAIEMEKAVSNAVRDSFKEIIFGEKILQALLKEDPNLLNLNLEKKTYTEACADKIAIVFSDVRISSKQAKAVVYLAEVGGVSLGLYMSEQ